MKVTIRHGVLLACSLALCSSSVRADGINKLSAYNQCIGALGSNDNYVIVGGPPPIGIAQIGGKEAGTPPTAGAYSLTPDGKAYFHPCSGSKDPSGNYYNLTYPGDGSGGALGSEFKLGPNAKYLASEIPAAVGDAAPEAKAGNSLNAYDRLSGPGGLDLNPKPDLAGLNTLLCEGESRCTGPNAENCKYTVSYHDPVKKKTLHCDVRACLPYKGINPCTNGIDMRSGTPKAVPLGLNKCEGHNVGDASGEKAFLPLLNSLTSRTFKRPTPQKISDSAAFREMQKTDPNKKYSNANEMDEVKAKINGRYFQQAKAQAQYYIDKSATCDAALGNAGLPSDSGLRKQLKDGKASAYAAFPELRPVGDSTNGSSGSVNSGGAQ